MRNTFKKTTLSLALATGLIGSATWSAESQACSADPIIASVCLMANGGRIMVGFVPAMGQQLQVNQYQALYSIMGNTYGGNNVNFNVPDLSGRVVVGSGTLAGTTTRFIPGQKGGATSQALTLAQLPQHVHALSGVTVDISKMTATTSLSGLTTTTDLSKVSFTSSSSSLSIKALNGAAASGNPTTSSALATLSAGMGAKIYGTGTPDTIMQAGTVVGTVSGTLSGTAPGTVTGTAATTLGGTVSLSGGTSAAGSATASVPTMMPFLVMNYSIATTGLYPDFQ